MTTTSENWAVQVAEAMRQAYADHIGDEIVPWDKAAPKKQIMWIVCAKAAMRVLRDKGGYISVSDEN